MRKKILFWGVFVIFLSLIAFRIAEVVRADTYKNYIDKVAPNGNMVINSVIPTSISEAFSYITYYLNSMAKDEYSNYGYSSIGKKGNNDSTDVNGIYEITFCKYKISDGVRYCDSQNSETVDINITFNDSKKDNSIQNRVSNYIENFEKGKQYYNGDNAPYEILIQIDDMELLNYLSKNKENYNVSNDPKYLFDLLEYNLTFRKITKDINYAHLWNVRGNGLDVISSIGSDLLFEYNNFIYGTSNSSIREFILNAIYIDENIENDTNSVMAAVQKRLDENLGKNIATISLGDSTYLDSMIDEAIEDFTTPYGIQIDKTKVVNQLFNINVGGYDYKFIVIKDSSKVKNLSTEAKLKITSVKNGDNELQLENGKYVLNSIDNEYININYELTNCDADKQYVVGFKQGDGYFDYRYYTQEVNGNYLSTHIDKNTTDYKLIVCDTDTCENIYDEIEIKFDYQVSEFLNNIKVVASNVKQAGVLVDGIHYDVGGYFDENNYYHYHGENTTEFNVNNKQVISVYLKAENLVENNEYTIFSGWEKNSIKYTGKELMDGVVYNFYPNLEGYNLVDENGTNYIEWNDSKRLCIYRNNVLITTVIMDNNDVLLLVPSVNKEVKNFTYQFSYKNYPKINIVEDGYVYKRFVFNRNYLNKNNPLNIDIKANNEYENKNYNLLIEIKKDNKIIYTKEEIVNGLLLNSGYTITLSGLELEYAKSMLDDISYNIDVAIDYVGTRKEAIYNSLGYTGLLYSKIYYKKGQQNLTTARGGGGPLFTSYYYSINNSLFTIYPEIYLKVQGENYADNELYDYKLEYGNFVNGYGIFEETIKTGKISGKVLNTVGIYLPVDNHNNYKNFQYRFIVSKGDEVIYAVAPTINQYNWETMSSARLVAKHRDLYLVTSYDPMISPYIATRNAPIDIIVSGLGFKNDEEYEFTVDYGYYDNDNQNDYSSIFTNHNSEDFAYEYQEKVTFLGKDINDGKAQIINKINTNNKYTGAYITITSSKGWGAIYVKFVDCKDLFKTFKKYTLDNTEDIIKKISKKTSIENFISNIEIIDNGTIKVFDKTGENEITNQIGTGMITRIINEYDENLLDLDVVVTGDISGDGNISVTDLAKLERYLAKLSDLDGVYKMAADANGNDSVTLTDLVKISRDIAKLEEIK